MRDGGEGRGTPSAAPAECCPPPPRLEGAPASECAIHCRRRLPPLVLQTQLYLLFKEQYPGMRVGRTLFCSLKPWYVRPKTELQLITCCCSACTNAWLLVKAVRHMQQALKAAAAKASTSGGSDAASVGPTSQPCPGPSQPSSCVPWSAHEAAVAAARAAQAATTHARNARHAGVAHARRPPPGG